MKKITKILPLVMALMLMGPAFAATAETASEQSSTMVLTVPEFLNITKAEDCVEEASAEFNADYTTLSLSQQMHAGFTVITNIPNKNIYLKGTCLSDDGDQNALFGSASALNIVFTNEDVQPSTSAVTHLTGGGATVESSPNAIAFTLTPSISTDNAQPKATLDAGKVTYELTNGKYDMLYTLGEQATEGSFSTHDAAGTYKATILLTDSAL